MYVSYKQTYSGSSRIAVYRTTGGEPCYPPNDAGGSRLALTGTISTGAGVLRTVAIGVTPPDLGTYELHALIIASGAEPNPNFCNGYTGANVTTDLDPNAPRNVYATAGNASAKVTWDPPTASGGSGVTSYRVTSSPGNISVTVSGSTTSATVTGLTNGTTYRFTVTATNLVGTSTTSPPSNPVTPSADPNKRLSPSDPVAPVRHTYGSTHKSPSNGDPVNLATGNLAYEREDFELLGLGPYLGFNRAYNSKDSIEGSLGFGWESSYSEHLRILFDRVIHVRNDGKQDTFAKTDTGLVPTDDVFDELVANADGTFTLTEVPLRLEHNFDAAGHLVSITDRNGNVLLVSPSAFDRFSDYRANQRLIEPFEAEEPGWQATRGTLNPELVHLKQGGQSFRLTNATAIRQGLNLNLWEFPDRSVSELDDGLSLWVWVEDVTALKSSEAVVVALNTTPDAAFRASWSRSALRTGWNHLSKPRSAFSTAGTGVPDWGSITQLAFEVWPETGRTASVAIDDFRLVRDQGGVPSVFGPTYSAPVGVWEWNGGEAFEASGSNAKLLSSGTPLTDGTVQGNVKYELLDGTAATPGIIFRASGDSNYYLLKIEPTRLVLSKSVAGVENELVSSPVVFASNTPYWLRATLSGPQIVGSYSADGTNFAEAVSVADSSFASGAIGLYSAGGGRNTFDDFGMVAYKVTGANGQSITFSRNSSGNIARLDVPGGRSMTFAYDTNQNQNLVSVTDFGGGVTLYSYDGSHRLLSVVSPAGRAALTNAYDAEGRVIAQSDGRGNTVRFAYDTVNRNTLYTDARGNATTYNWDDQLRLVSEADPLGGAATYSYDNSSNYSSIVDKRGQTIAFDYVGADLKGVADPTANFGFVYNTTNDLIRSVDGLGAATNYSYDTSGNLSEVTDSLGRTTDFETASNGLTTKVTDPLGDSTSLAYDSLGRLIEERDTKGGTTTFSYDAAGNLTTVTDALSNSTRHEYDPLGRRTKTFDALGNANSFAYDGDGNLISITDSMGNVTSYQFDGASNVSEVTRHVTIAGVPTVLITRFEYDASNSRTKMTDAAGNVTRYEYDAENRLVAVVGPTGARTELQYDANGNQTVSLDPLGHQTVSSYDSANRLTSVRDSLGNVTSYSYDANGNVTKITDPKGGVTIFEYDALGQVIRSTDPVGNTTSYAYDAAGRIIGQTDPLGNSWQSSYDANGLLMSETDPLGDVERYEYDALGRQIKVVDPNGHDTAYAYDALGRLVSQTDPLGKTTAFTYDANGNQTSVTNPLGRKTQYEFDELNRITAAIDALNQRTSYEYDRTGNLLRVVDTKGNPTTFAYDPQGNRTRTTDALGRSQQFIYDGEGRLLSQTNARGQTITFAYDPEGRLTRTTYPDAPAVEYTYDEMGRRVTMTDQTGVTRYTYDAAGNRTRLQSDWQSVDLSYTNDANGKTTRISGSILSRPYLVDSTYDAAGRLATVNSSTGSATHSYDRAGNVLEIALGNGTKRKATYDVANRVSDISNLKNDGSTISRFAYTYDAAGNVVRRVGANGLAEVFAYDALDRLSRWSHGEDLGLVDSYIYDAMGNRTRQVSPSGITNYSYDPANQLVSETGLGTGLAPSLTTYSYDLDGSRVAAVSPLGTSSWTYDSANRLTGVSGQIGAAQFTYGGTGKRITSVTAEGQSNYVYDDDSLLATGGTLSGAYVWGSGGRLAFTLDAIGQPIYVYTDALGSITDEADASGSSLGSRSFDPFGNKVLETGRRKTPFTFVGSLGVLDDTPSAGSYQMGRRAYQAGAGVFMSPDSPIINRFVPQGFNRYQYAFNNPLSLVDPAGNWPSVAKWVSQKVKPFFKARPKATQAKTLPNSSMNAKNLSLKKVADSLLSKMKLPKKSTFPNFNLDKGSWAAKPYQLKIGLSLSLQGSKGLTVKKLSFWGDLWGNVLGIFGKEVTHTGIIFDGVEIAIALTDYDLKVLKEFCIGDGYSLGQGVLTAVWYASGCEAWGCVEIGVDNFLAKNLPLFSRGAKKTFTGQDKPRGKILDMYRNYFDSSKGRDWVFNSDHDAFKRDFREWHDCACRDVPK